MTDELKNILERVRCIYIKYGVKSVTMDDVSRELGISKKTLYQYVNDRADLVAKVLEYETNLRICEMERVHSIGENAIAEMIEVHKHVQHSLKDFNPAREYDLRKYYPELYEKYISERRNRIVGKIKANIERGKYEGLYRIEINSDVISKLLAMRAEMIADNEIFNFQEFMSEPFFREVTIYHLRGLASDKGIEVLEKLIK